MIFQLAGLLLSAIGVLLTLFLSDPILQKIKEVRIERKLESEWEIDEIVEEGIIPVKDDYAWVDWSVSIKINERGDADHDVTGEVYNTSEDPLQHVDIPLYCDEPNIHRDMLDIWARSEGREVEVELENWDAANSRGRMRINLYPPLDPRESQLLKFGYRLPRLLKPGEEYYNWDISVRHFEFNGSIEFDDAWNVMYARWDQNISTPTAIDWDPDRIEWDVQFPEVGERMKLIMELEKE
jgi:hypothetical protein